MGTPRYPGFMHVYRWDLDRTYLDTDIRSMRGMIRSALETASEKRNVPGADALLRALLAHDPTSRATILSGSPTQMREVLEQKLTLDGIRFQALDLKDNVGNLRRGRLRAVRGQVGYKLPRLLAHRVGEAPDTTESLFGDDAEADALIYAVYADAVAGRITPAELESVLRVGHAYDDQIAQVLDLLPKVDGQDAVEDIWILVDRRLPLHEFRRLGPKVHVVFSWFQAALALWARGRLSAADVPEVASGVGPEHAQLRRIGLLQDAVRRGLITGEHLERLLDEAPALDALLPRARSALAHLGTSTHVLAPPEARDYAGFLRASRAFDGAANETSKS